jgi:hypothetical protein
MQCNRDRLLTILAERTADLRATPPAERHRFVTQHVSEWRLALSQAYAGETVRVTTERITRDTRAARNSRIVAALASGQAVAAVARAEGVSAYWARMIYARNCPA